MKLEAPVSIPPQAYLDIINPLIDNARNLLEKGETLQAFAFVGNLTTKQVVAVTIHAGDDDAKDESARNVKTSAMVIEADFVFVVMEAWSLRADKLPQMDAILDKYGSIGASPYRIDVASFTLETRHGLWVAHPMIKPKGISKKKRTFGPIEFRFFTEADGRFVHLLPDKRDAEKPATLH